MMHIQKKIYTFILILTISVSFSFTPIHYVQAGAWGEGYASTAIKIIADELLSLIHDIITSVVEIAAIQTINSVLDKALGTDTPGYILDYTDFIFADASERAQGVIMNKLRHVLRGTGNIDYQQGNSAKTSSVGRTYNDQLGESAYSAAGIINTNTQETTINSSCTFDENGMPDLFGTYESPSFGCMSNLWNPNNHPISLALTAESMSQNVKIQEEKSAEVEAQSSGVIGKRDEHGNISIPSSIVEEVQLERITSSIDAANNSESYIGKAIMAAFAKKMINKIVSETANRTASKYRNNIRRAGSKIGRETEKQIKADGPGVIYDDNALYNN